MATFQKRSNRWRAIVRKKGHDPISKTFQTKEQAARWAREVEYEMDSRAFKDPRILNRTTVGDLIDRHRREMPTPGRTKDACLAMLARELGDVALADLTKPRIIQYAKMRANDHGAGPATVAQDLIYLRGLLEVARAHWDIPVLVEAAIDARLVLRREGLIAPSIERDRRPTPDELEQLRTYWERPLLRDMQTPMWDIVRFAIASAMRLSEIVAICWDDINETDRTILIRDRKHPSKKLGNDQTVPLFTEAWEIVHRQTRRDKEPRIFPFKAQSISANFTRAVMRCRIDDLHFHDMRHHAISLLFEAGYQVQEVALISGHRDWKQLKRYTQIQAKDLRREVSP
ncbi:tyrosine-type recombinase/integrase [Thiobaca trueperi]|uniref:Phage integrase family protein n=1 Tax=Thiobaca trueperi TaxID=127458 RepID=A0A4R3MZ23_9GAMM|nr:site-specific integrase [Thiobaca trueperi]TCT19559.1 phage integrase family protein [Thiobaca trueperi]